MISVIITRTCIPFSYAKYSAVVNAILGVAILSIAGSDARFINKTDLSIAPVFLNSSTKNCASSNVIPIAANTTANLESELRTFACLAIWAANCACGRPDAENTGSFCPLTRVFNPSIADIPVWINSEGKSLATGLIASPLISLLSSGIISGPLSFGLPIPSKTLPSISSETPISSGLPKNLAFVPFKFIPVEPSKICTMAFEPLISSTLPLLFSPVCNSISTNSSYLTPSTPSTTIKGPTTSVTVLYSLSILYPSLIN